MPTIRDGRMERLILSQAANLAVFIDCVTQTPVTAVGLLHGYITINVIIIWTLTFALNV